MLDRLVGWIALLTLLQGLGCRGELRARPGDSGTSDAGARDARASDAARVDGSRLDAGSGPDSDVGRLDAGSAPDAWAPSCTPPGVAESCNGLDDDCNGVADDAIADLVCGTGACSASAPGCVAATPGTCTPGAPAAEVCINGLDDDCDGTADDGCACSDGASAPCFGGAAAWRGVGACVEGTHVCSAGAFGACIGEGAPSPETCNGIDDDCNGAVDDALGTLTCGTGSCAASVPRCAGGVLQTCTPAITPRFDVAAARGGDAPVMTRASYDYVPSILHDGVWRMWWCGGIAGDHILYAQASSLDGPWRSRDGTRAFDDVLQPTGDLTDFDGTHVCDPSVVRVDGRYYMYYGGYPLPGDGETTRIGVASSDDGITWTRLNGGRPIVVPARDWRPPRPNAYGAGQPSVVYLDGLFYLVFTDTTGLGANPFNGAGQFVLRSADPTFQTGVEQLGAGGFAPFDAATHTSHSLIEAFSVDWQFVDVLDAFALALSASTLPPARLHTEIVFFDRTLGRELGRIELAGTWTEGPGLASRPDRHALPSGECGRVALDVLRSVGPGGPDTWDLAHTGADLVTAMPCDCLPLGRIFEGSLIGSAGLPLAMVRGGRRLHFALAAPALRFARSYYDVPAAVYGAIPHGASMFAGADVIGAPARPAAFVLDDGRRWPVSCFEAIIDNGSSIRAVTAAEWDAIPGAESLFCLR